MLRFLARFADDDAHAAERLHDAAGTAAGARREPLHRDRLAHRRLGDDERVDVEIVVVLRVGDRRGEHLADLDGHRLGRELEDVERILGLAAADELRDEVQLLGRAADLRADRERLVVGDLAGGCLLAHGLPLALLVGGVAGEVARRRELAELHPDHVLVDRDGDEFPAVVDVERQADELRQDGGAARPGLDRRAAVRVLRGFGLLQKAELDERAFPDGAGHFFLFFLAWRDRMIILSVALLLRVRAPLVGLPQGVTGWRPPEVRPSPPPCGWSTGFLATPRVSGRLPIQRLRPALAKFWFWLSGLETAPTVAMQFEWI